MSAFFVVLRDLIPRRLKCPFGCNVTTFYGARMDAHIRIDHAGDRAPRCERSHW